MTVLCMWLYLILSFNSAWMRRIHTLLCNENQPPLWYSCNSIVTCNINALKINAINFPLIGLYLITTLYEIVFACRVFVTDPTRFNHTVKAYFSKEDFHLTVIEILQNIWQNKTNQISCFHNSVQELTMKLYFQIYRFWNKNFIQSPLLYFCRTFSWLPPWDVVDKVKPSRYKPRRRLRGEAV